MTALNDAGVPAGPIYDIDQMIADSAGRAPRDRHARRPPTARMDPRRRAAVQLERTPQPPQMRSAAPELGEHSDEVLASIGYDAETIAGLRERGVV